MSTPATKVSLPPASAAHAIALGMLAGKRYRPNYVISGDGLTLTIQMVQMPSGGCIDYDAQGIPIVKPPPLTDATAFDPAGTAATLVATLTAGSPDELNTFLEAYNRFLSDESAASALNAALSAETSARTTADSTEATARAAAVTAEASARNTAIASAVEAVTPHKTTATVDFGYANGNGEGDYATTTVSAPWVSSTSWIICRCSPSGSADHTTDETIAEGITFDVVNIVPATSFDVKAFAPAGTWGRHDCTILAL